MGYTLELWHLPLNRLLEELRAPTLPADAERAPNARVFEHWQTHAEDVSSALVDGGQVDGDEALYVVAVIRSMGEHFGSLEHTSSGGEEFRAYLDGPASQLLGRELVDHLLGRRLDRATWAEYPSIGWASAHELRMAANRGAPPPAEIDDPYEIVRDLEHIVRIAAATGRDIVSIYL